MLTIILAATLGGTIRSCATAQSYATSHYAPAIVQPHVAAKQYVAPAYNYSVDKVVFIAVEDQPDYYSALVGSGPRHANQAATAQGLAEKVNGLTAAIATLETTVRALAGANAGTNANAAPPPVPSPAPNTPASTPASTPAPLAPGIPGQPSDIAQAATTILKNNCLKCHRGGTAQGGIKLFEDDGKLANLSASTLLKVDASVYSGSMPLNGKALEPADYSTLRAFIAENQDKIDEYLKKCQETAK